MMPELQHINTSHVIRQLSFGPSFPGACAARVCAPLVLTVPAASSGSVNPLDGVVRIAAGKETARLVSLMDRLRADCPWDRKQTF